MKEKAAPYVSSAIDTIKEKAPHALESAKYKISNLKDQAAPYIESAKD